eukprot:scaffold189872_cov27-Tisochrysis_lutea.AAC.2
MEFLTQNQNALFANPAAKGTTETTPDVGLTSKYDGAFTSAHGKHVIVIGGGDTGTDCIGTSLRHGCKTLTNFELFPAPPAERAEGNPWPLWPRIMRVDYGHEEAAQRFGNDPRSYSILSKEFVSDGAGNVKAVRTVNIAVGADGRFKEVEGSEKEWPADLVILAMGFRHPEQTILRTLDLETDARNNTKANTKDYRTSFRGVFAAGDCRRGQSLVVWAINEGRGVAKVRAPRVHPERPPSRAALRPSSYPTPQPGGGSGLVNRPQRACASNRRQGCVWGVQPPASQGRCTCRLRRSSSSGVRERVHRLPPALVCARRRCARWTRQRGLRFDLAYKGHCSVAPSPSCRLRIFVRAACRWRATRLLGRARESASPRRRVSAARRWMD